MSDSEPYVSKDMARQMLTRKYGEEARAAIDEGGGLYYIEYQEVYGSTAGPYGGVGGQAMTAFKIRAWYSPAYMYAVVFVPDKILRVTDYFLVFVQGEQR